MAVTPVGTPAAAATSNATNTPSATPAFSGTQTDAAGDYLVAVVTIFGSTTAGLPGTPSGWTQLIDSGAGTIRVTIFTKVAAGSDVLPAFSATNTGTAANSCFSVELYQLTGQDATIPVPVTGSAVSGAVLNLTVTSSANVPAAGCYVICGIMFARTTVATATYTPGSGFTNTASDAASSLKAHSAFDVQANPASGAAVSDAASWTAGTGLNNAGALIVVQPPRNVPVLIAGQAVQRSATW